MKKPLKVLISSFSYKQGCPTESSSHGGGFVFDCRCLPNPGREAAYQDKTGHDPVVRDYLERFETVRTFYDHCRSLVEQAVSDYVNRGFDQLFVGFGCTGGQHRSVYLAERLAADVSRLSGVKVEVGHQVFPRSQESDAG